MIVPRLPASKVAGLSGQAAIMNLSTTDLHSIVVADEMVDWRMEFKGVVMMSVWDYLNRKWSASFHGLKVYNLCSSYSYQSAGYYVSLLAPTNGHKVFPSAGTVQDLRHGDLPVAVLRELEILTAKCLTGCKENECVINIYFGHSRDSQVQELANFLFYFFPSPLLQACFSWDGTGWRLKSCGALAPGDISGYERDFILDSARLHFAKTDAVSRVRPAQLRKLKTYQLAILVNHSEQEAPSDSSALSAFEKAATDLGMSVRFLEKADAKHVPAHDALFIRETTAVNHHSYEIASLAERAGLIVMDDTESILRCTNKVFLAQLMQRHGIPQPDTIVIHQGNLGCVPHLIGFPCVIKRPDSQFSLGVIKVHDMAELRQVCHEMMRDSDLLVAQRYEFSPFDWRVGVLDGVPLYACRYHMADEHWQVVRRDADGRKHEGGHDTLAIEDAPAAVVRVAVAAANAVGRGLYGVDLKQLGDRIKVIEVNDNPNIDAGVEDLVLGPLLYRRIIGHFIKRIDATRFLHEQPA
ncbi:MAG: RimK family protein [Prosthecobacter sp.]|nr:RimK family protein [Prosthecobacter sp.]